MNAADDGLAGIQQLAGDATLLFYMSDEAQEGRDAYVEKRRARLLAVPSPAVTEQVNKWVARGPAAHAAGLGRAGRRRDGVRGRERAASIAVARGRGDGRRARDPGRHQLRERLRGRRPRHRRRQRVGPVRLVASGLATPSRCARPRSCRCRLPRSPVSRWRSPSSPWLLLVGALVVRWRGGSTPAGRSPTGTSGSARCSCSCSSGSSPRRVDVRADREDHCGRGRRSDPRRTARPPRCSSSNNLRDIPTDGRRASARWPCGSAISARAGCTSCCS